MDVDSENKVLILDCLKHLGSAVILELKQQRWGQWQQEWAGGTIGQITLALTPNPTSDILDLHTPLSRPLS